MGGWEIKRLYNNIWDLVLLNVYVFVAPFFWTPIIENTIEDIFPCTSGILAGGGRPARGGLFFLLVNGSHFKSGWFFRMHTATG